MNWVLTTARRERWRPTPLPGPTRGAPPPAVARHPRPYALGIGPVARTLLGGRTPGDRQGTAGGSPEKHHPRFSTLVAAPRRRDGATRGVKLESQPRRKCS